MAAKQNAKSKKLSQKISDAMKRNCPKESRLNTKKPGAPSKAELSANVRVERNNGFATSPAVRLAAAPSSSAGVSTMSAVVEQFKEAAEFLPSDHYERTSRSSDESTENNGFTPRKNQPTATQDQSPSSVRPSALLELSDEDDDEDYARNDDDDDDEIEIRPPRSYHPLVHHSSVSEGASSEVLLVDASDRRGRLGDTEIDIDIQVAHSPNKIIRHGVSEPVSRDLRLTDKELEDSRMQRKLTTVPSIHVTESSYSQESFRKTPVVAAKISSPIVVRESIISGQMLTAHPDRLAQESRVAEHYNALKSRASKHGQSPAPGATSRQYDSSEVTSENSEADHQGVDLQAQPLNSPDTVDDQGPKLLRGVDRTSSMPSHQDFNDLIKTRKKTAGRTVTSRYLQPTPAHSKGPMKATDRNFVPPSASGLPTQFARSTALRRSASDKQRRSLAGPEVFAVGGGNKTKDIRPPITSLYSGHISESHGDGGGVTLSVGSSTKLRTSADSSVFLSNSSPELHHNGDNVKNSNRHASTPTADESLFTGQNPVDVSAIGPLPALGNLGMAPGVNGDRDNDPNQRRGSHTFRSQSMRCTRSDAHSSQASGPGHSRALFSSMASASEWSGTMDVRFASDHSAGTSGSHRNEGDDNWCPTQLDLDLAYGRNVQLAFILAKQRFTFKEQEKEAMAQMHALQLACEEQDRILAQYDLEYETLCHLNAVDDALEVQSRGLAPIESKLNQIHDQYTHLAEALDTTRHHMPTKGIYIPDNEEQYLAEIDHALQESEDLLAQISALSRRETPAIVEYAKTIESTENIVSTVIKGMAKTSELLSAINTLTTKENSLRIQQIQQQQMSSNHSSTINTTS